MTETMTKMPAAAQYTAEPRQTYTSVRIAKDLIARIKVQVEKGLYPSITRFAAEAIRDLRTAILEDVARAVKESMLNDGPSPIGGVLQAYARYGAINNSDKTDVQVVGISGQADFMDEAFRVIKWATGSLSIQQTCVAAVRWKLEKLEDMERETAPLAALFSPIVTDAVIYMAYGSCRGRKE